MLLALPPVPFLKPVLQPTGPYGPCSKLPSLSSPHTACSDRGSYPISPNLNCMGPGLRTPNAHPCPTGTDLQSHQGPLARASNLESSYSRCIPNTKQGPRLLTPPKQGRKVTRVRAQNDGPYSEPMNRPPPEADGSIHNIRGRRPQSSC